MKNKFILLLPILIILLGCEKEIELEINENESKLVLNGWIITGESPLVEINRSTFIFGKRGTDLMDNANVRLFEDDQEIGQLFHKEAGYYTNENIIIKAETDYKILASSDGYEEIESFSSSPKILNSEDYQIDFKENVVSTGYSNKHEISISIKDDKSTEDYYMFRLKSNLRHWDADSSEDTVYYSNYDHMDPLDPQTESSYIFESGMVNILSDQLFNGNDYTSRLSFYDYYGNDGYNVGLEEHIGYAVEVYKITKDLYLYLKSVESNRYPDPFTEPTQIYSNVLNGYGIFASSSKLEITIE